MDEVTRIIALPKRCILREEDVTEPENLLGQKKTLHAPGREHSEGKLITGASQDLRRMARGLGMAAEETRAAGRGAAGQDDCSRKTCGTRRAGRGAVQGPAPRELPHADPGHAAPVPAPSQQPLLPWINLRDGSVQTRGVRGVLGSTAAAALPGWSLCGAVPRFPYLQTGRSDVRYPGKALRQPCLQKCPSYRSSNPPFPCRGKLLCVLFSGIKLLEAEGDAGSAPLAEPARGCSSPVGFQPLFSPQPCDRYLKRS